MCTDFGIVDKIDENQLMPKQYCNGITGKKTRCKRLAGDDGYCHQHTLNKQMQEGQEFIEEAKQPEDPALLAERLKVCEYNYFFCVFYNY